MIKSMTGFGRAVLESEGKNITVEIRTLNSKQLDLNTRIPLLFKNYENEIRSILSKELERAKADFTITVENRAVNSAVAINSDLAMSYYQTLSELSKNLGNPVESDIFLHVLRMPDVISTPQEEVNEDLWNKLRDAILEACGQLNEFRISEGKVLERDFVKRITMIRDMIDEVTPFEEYVRSSKTHLKTLRQRCNTILTDWNKRYSTILRN